MRKLQFVIAMFIISILTPNMFYSVSANSTNVSISSGSAQSVNLGVIDKGMEIEIDYSVNDDIDVILMTSSQHSSWQSGSTNHIESGSDYEDNSDDYVFTTLSSDTYYLVLDNSNSIGLASDTGSTVTGTVDVLISSPSTHHLKTRAWVDVDSFVELDIGSVQSGDVISTSVSCDIGLTNTDDLDFLFMDSLQTSSLSTSQWNWNKHNSFEDTCSHSWEYETGKNTGWSLIVDNTDNARTNGVNSAISVDVEIEIRNLIPLVEIADTSRMIDSGDYYRIDLGYQIANSVVDIDYSYWSHGTAMLTDDLDILVMKSNEANNYENSNDGDILGHASELDASAQSWSYQFPEAGSYSIIFDNTDEPTGGAGDGSDIQVEIGITSLTIPSLFGNIWTGWHQSRHYADEGDHMALDLGSLNSGDDIYYYVDGKNIGGSIWSSKEFDILFMTKDNYDLYANGSTPDIISDGTKYKEDGLIPAIANISVSTSDSYVLVFDAADGPNSNSADENGDWVWEFIVLSDGGSITNLQAQDNQYENTISVGTINAPDSDSDGIRNGLDECPSTPSGANVDSTGCSTSQLDDDGDGVSNSIDQCSNTPTGESTNSVGCSQSQLDDDGDGVSNSEDQCPNTPSGANVDSNGCEIVVDSDGDGVPDSSDQCPNTPAGESTNSVGCSQSQLDDDGDGVSNSEDQCPNTTSGANVDANGCEIVSDSDGDGVPDSSDQCPNTPAGESTNSVGCSQSQLDDDGDGVSNSEDQCPNTTSGANVDANGCEIVSDSDGDGVPDSSDQCPNTPAGANVDSNGCEELVDSDADGVDDTIDQCPSTPVGEATDSVGCSQSQLDDDGDGVPNSEDQCPNTPTGTNVDTTGCEEATDSDGDGVEDSADLCPNTAAGITVDVDGCELVTDSDGDGVEDSLDQCPNTTTGTTVDSTGCKITDNPSQEETTENKSEKEESGSLPGFSVIIGLLSILLAATISRFEK